jgi:hypothetical protein
MSREKWYKWHWDKSDAQSSDVRTLETQYKRIIRWRRGSFLTVYRQESTHGDIQWWFYLPFNLAIGFGYPEQQ